MMTALVIQGDIVGIDMEIRKAQCPLTLNYLEFTDKTYGVPTLRGRLEVRKHLIGQGSALSSPAQKCPIQSVAIFVPYFTSTYCNLPANTTVLVCQPLCGLYLTQFYPTNKQARKLTNGRIISPRLKLARFLLK